MQTQPLVAIITVNYNGGHLLLHSVAAALASNVALEVWVVDNGSDDGSLQALHSTYGYDLRLHIIENGINLGFAAANNVALKRINSPWVLLLNPDCLIQADTIERMIAVLIANPKAGMGGCLICNPDGHEQAGCRRASPTALTGLARAFYLDRWLLPMQSISPVDLLGSPLPAIPTPVEAISGAFMLLRREAIDQVGLLDEGYFLHCEDLDWCQTFRNAGWCILFVPDVKVIHYKGTCSTSRPLFVLWHKHHGMVRFYWKFLSYRYHNIFNWLVVLGIWLRFLVLVPIEISLNPWKKTEFVMPFNPASFPFKPVLKPAVPIFTMLQDRRVLVTGGTGFVGTHLVRELLRQGARVRIFSRSVAHSTNLWSGQSVEWVSGDLLEPGSLAGICSGMDIVFHLASSAHIFDDEAHQDNLHNQVTALGTTTLLQEAELAQVKCLIFISSVKAMGEGDKLCLDETSPELPEGAYGRAKLQAEKLVVDTGRRIGMRVAILRLPLVYGPGNKGNLPRMIQAIRARHFPRLPKVKNRRSMVHVDDVVQAMLLAAVKEESNGRTYIVTDGEAYSSADLEYWIRKELGQRLSRWVVPMWLLQCGAWMGDLAIAYGWHPPLHSSTLRKLFGSAWYSNARIRQELGFCPRFNVQSTLPTMVKESMQLPTT